MKTALTAIALTAYMLAITIQTKITTNIDNIIIAQQNGGPTITSYIYIMSAFYLCGIFATTGILVSLLTPAKPQRKHSPYSIHKTL